MLAPLAPVRNKVVDLSHLLTENGLSYCPSHPRFNSEQVHSLPKDGLNVSRLILGSHTGTHLDAPSHFLEGAPTISDVDLSLLVGPAVVVDVRGKEPDGAITWDDIGSQSEQLGPETILLFCTGWSKLWGRDDYMKCPHLAEDAARKIIGRGVRIVGIDVVDIDGGIAPHAIHHLLLGSGVLIAENLTNVEALLDGGAYIASLLPLNLKGCDGSPIRAIAWSE
jgi:kynurenine formamidase